MRSLTNQQTVRCPNCGSEAKRRYFTSSNQGFHRTCPDNKVIQTECEICDYLMVMCSLDGSVVEAQAPGTSIPTHSSQENPVTAIVVKKNWPLALPLLN